MYSEIGVNHQVKEFCKRCKCIELMLLTITIYSVINVLKQVGESKCVYG